MQNFHLKVCNINISSPYWQRNNITSLYLGLPTPSAYNQSYTASRDSTHSKNKRIVLSQVEELVISNSLTFNLRHALRTVYSPLRPGRHVSSSNSAGFAKVAFLSQRFSFFEIPPQVRIGIFA